MQIRCLTLAALGVSFLGSQVGAAPSRDPAQLLPQLRDWHEHESFSRIRELLGSPDAEIVSGFSITSFALSDGSTIYVKATPSHNRIFTIERSRPGRLAEKLYEPLGPYLNHPLPSSAPF